MLEVLIGFISGIISGTGMGGGTISLPSFYFAPFNTSSFYNYGIGPACVASNKFGILCSNCYSSNFY